mgnify:FL=1
MKALFRGIAMVVPDAYAIINVRLAALGFRSAWRNAHRLHQLLLAAPLLTKQLRRYDWGLRTAIAILRSIATAVRVAGSLPTDVEESVLVVTTVEKLLFPTLDVEDRGAFSQLVDSTFRLPKDVKQRTAEEDSVVEAMKEATLAQMLVPNAYWSHKALEVRSHQCGSLCTPQV